MRNPDINLARYGTVKESNQGKKVITGSFSFWVEESGLRRICWNGIEVVRGLSALIRDEDWGSLAAENMHEVCDENVEVFTLTRYASYLDDALEVILTFSAYADGRLDATFQMTAKNDVLVNRAGFTLLHPVIGVAGHPVQVRHGDGNRDSLQFPEMIAPAQPILNIAGLSHQVDGIQILIDFEGEIFEMEDQRNWSDASFKTYCRPLSLPFPYRIGKGEKIHQSVHIRITEPTNAPEIKTNQPIVKEPVTNIQAPEILLAVQPEWGMAGPHPGSGLLLRLRGKNSSNTADLATLSKAAKNANNTIDIELIIETENPLSEIKYMAKKLEKSKIVPRHIIALPAAYLKSYQPSGPWPAGLTPSDCATAAAAVFPDAKIGVGMLTNFTEVNRCRPLPGQGDYLTHGNSAIVHAADDLSVLETLEALPLIFKSGRTIADKRDYRLGLVSIGMRSNPYGSTLSKNPDLQRKTMTDEDPRQKGLFAAAYAIGVATSAAKAGIKAVALGAINGPFGVTNPDGSFRPIYHAIKAISSIAGYQVEPISGMPKGLTGLRFEGGIIVANCSLDYVELKTPPRIAAILDVTQFETAAANADWILDACESVSAPITLGPFACLFAGTKTVA